MLVCYGVIDWGRIQFDDVEVVEAAGIGTGFVVEGVVEVEVVVVVVGEVVPITDGYINCVYEVELEIGVVYIDGDVVGVVGEVVLIFICVVLLGFVIVVVEGVDVEVGVIIGIIGTIGKFVDGEVVVNVVEVEVMFFLSFTVFIGVTGDVTGVVVVFDVSVVVIVGVVVVVVVDAVDVVDVVVDLPSSISVLILTPFAVVNCLPLIPTPPRRLSPPHAPASLPPPYTIPMINANNNANPKMGNNLAHHPFLWLIISMGSYCGATVL